MAEPPVLVVVQRASGRETVLLVEDEPTIRMAVAEELSDLGCTVMEDIDGKTALRALQSGAHVELLLTDVSLPGGMAGRLIADASRTSPNFKVLFIRGYAENSMIGKGPAGARNGGADEAFRAG